MKRASRRLLIAAVATPTVAAALVVALAVTAFAALASTVSSGGGGDAVAQAAACDPTGGSMSGLSAEQTTNAALIAAVARRRGLGTAGAVIAVMTALTESSLLNIDHGDAAGRDSRGLFQQRETWGSVSVRMDPAGAAGLFFDRLETVGGWRDLPPWVVAQQVQRSAFDDGSNYAAHYATAVAVVVGLSGGTSVAGDFAGGAGDPADLGADPNPAGDAAGFDLAAFCASGPDGAGQGGWGGFDNGLAPASALCPLTAAGQLLRCDAATAWNTMAAAFEANTGSPMCITDSYRTLDAQIRLRAEKPTLAAVPGTSNHGWALAVDLCEPGRAAMGFTTTTYRWLQANAARFGFTHPAWAEPDRGQEEPWHWEYTRGTS